MSEIVLISYCGLLACPSEMGGPLYSRKWITPHSSSCGPTCLQVVLGPSSQKETVLSSTVKKQTIAELLFPPPR